jgi:hypothetical protein
MGLALFCSVSRPTHVWTLPRARHRPGGQWRHAHPAPLHRPHALHRPCGRAGPGPVHLPGQPGPPARGHALLRGRRAAARAGGRPHPAPHPRLLPVRARADRLGGACRLAAELRIRGRHRPLRDHADPTRPVRRLLPGTVPPAAGQPPGGAGGGHQHAADSGALQLRRERPPRRLDERRAPPAHARRVRSAGPRRDGRRHRERHALATPRRGAAPEPVHRAARGLFAAAPAPLHRHRARMVPELRAVHELPVLHGRVHRHGPRRDGRPGQRVHRLCRARQRGNASRRTAPRSDGCAWKRAAKAPPDARPTT